MKQLTVLQIFAPVSFFLRLLRLTPYKTKNKNKIYSHINVFVTFFCGFSCIFLAIAYYAKHKFLPIRFLKISSVRYMIILRSIGANLGMLEVLFFLLDNAKKLFEINISINEDIDVKLKTLNLGDELVVINYHHRRLITILVIIVHFIFNILADCYTSLTKPDKILFIIITIYPHLTCSCINVIFSGYTIIIESRFRMLNIFLQKKNFKRIELDKILKCADYIHKKLTFAAKNLCDLYSFHLLLWYTVCFVLFVLDLHAGMFEIVQKNTGRYYNFILTTWKNCVVYAFDLCYIANRCRKLCLEANKTKSVIVGLNIDYSNEEERNMVSNNQT